MNNKDDTVNPEGVLVVKEPKYKCPKHGDIGNQTLWSSLAGREAKLCLHCYIEKLIEIGVCSVTEIKEK